MIISRFHAFILWLKDKFKKEKTLIKYIELKQCKNLYLYRILARNGNFGIFIKERNTFILSRQKFGSNYPFEEYHYDTGPPFGTVRPIEEIELSPFTQKDLTEEFYKTEGFETFGYKNDIDILLYLNEYEEKYYENKKNTK